VNNKVKKWIIIVFIVLVIGTPAIYFIHRWMFGPDSLPSAPDLSWVREANESTHNLVVFIHGIGSDSTSAWTSGKTGAYWPRMLSNDPDFSSFAILTASYRSPYIKHAASIEQAAQMLGTRLRDTGAFARFSNVFFITHSMGGLIGRRILVNLVNIQDEQAVKRVAVIFFFGTPTSGAPLADLGKWITANPQASNLGKSDLNAFLQELDNGWENLLRRRSQRTDDRPRVFCAYELQSTGLGLIVPTVYAKTWCDEAAQPFERNHFDLVKPDDDKNDPVYAWTKVRLLRVERRNGQVSWNAGENLGALVGRLQSAYRGDRVPEQVRFSSSAEAKLSSLWIPHADYRRDSWGELFQAVAADHPCLAVKIIDPGRMVELDLRGRTRSCHGRTICAATKCEP
jgi:hypothetical protein